MNIYPTSKNSEQVSLLIHNKHKALENTALKDIFLPEKRDGE